MFLQFFITLLFEKLVKTSVNKIIVIFSIFISILMIFFCREIISKNVLQNMFYYLIFGSLREAALVEQLVLRGGDKIK